MTSFVARAIFLLLLILGTAFGQSEVGGASLNGTVTDPTGASVAGARVTATNVETGVSRTIESSDAGLYNFVRLPIGRYEVTVEQPGFQSLKRTNVTLTIGAVITVDVALQVGQTQETVTVNADAPIIETTRSQTSTVVNEKAIRDLPINNRNFLDFATLTPGVVRDPRGGDLSFAGQKGTLNSLQIDGVDANNLFFGQSAGRAGVRSPYTFSQESVSEFQVNASTFAAEIGRAGGGVINVVTRSGTNDLHGTAFWFYREDSLNANRSSNKFTVTPRFREGIPRQPYGYDQFGGNLGGPIVRNRVFFFVNYEGQRNTDPVTLFVPEAPTDPASQAGFAAIQPYLAPYSTGNKNDIGLVKVDWAIGSTQQLNARYNIHRFEGLNFENTFQVAAEGTGNSNVSGDNVSVNYNRVFGSSLVWDARFNYNRDDLPGTANSDLPQTVVRQLGQQAVAFGRNSFSPRYTNSDRYQTIQAVSYVRGRHTYKLGADLNFERIANFFPGNFSGVYTFNSYADFANRRPFSFTQGFAGAGTDGPLTQPNVNEYAFFVQDQWRATDRLTLNYGVRYDLFDHADPSVRNDNQALLAANLRTDRMNLDTNNWAPRFGFAYRLTDSERAVVRGGYGLYYGRTPSIVTGTAHSQNGIQVRTFTVNAGDPQLPTYPNVLATAPVTGQVPDIYVFAPDYVQPVTQQWSLNVETRLASDYAVTLGYLGVRGMHLTRSRDINLFPAELVPATGVLRFATQRPNAAFGRITLFDSGGDSTYHGGFVQLTKRYSRNFQVLVNYTYSKVIDTVPDATSVVVGGGDDAKVAQNTLLPNLDRAVGDADTPHRFVLSGVWDIAYADRLGNPFARYVLGGWQLSPIFQASSGRPFSQRVVGDLNNDRNTRTDRPAFVGRNTERLPTFATLDLRLAKSIPLGERLRLQLIGEAFNLTNRTNITGVNATVGAPSYLYATTSGDPRIVQLAAKFIF